MFLKTRKSIPTKSATTNNCCHKIHCAHVKQFITEFPAFCIAIASNQWKDATFSFSRQINHDIPVEDFCKEELSPVWFKKAINEMQIQLMFYPFLHTGGDLQCQTKTQQWVCRNGKGLGLLMKDGRTSNPSVGYAREVRVRWLKKIHERSQWIDEEPMIMRRRTKLWLLSSFCAT